MSKTIYISILVTVFITTISCTPKKRLSRLVKLHPELTTTDTIKINDIVITTQTRIDTAFHHSIIKDTIIIEKEKLKLQIVEIRDTIYVEVEHEADTIVIEKEIPVEKIANQKQDKNGIQSLDDLLNGRWFWVLVGCIFVLIMLRVFFPAK